MTKKLKKTTAFLSAVAMVMAMLLYFPSGMFSNIDWGLKASAEGETQTENWIDSAEAFAGGTGTEGDPYQIATAEQLAYLAQQVNTGTDYFGVFFKLTADINLGGKEWTPIGTDETKAFTGEFSGDGHKITNLKIESTGDYVGLFGCNMGKITNVGIEGGSVKGGKYVGGVCGSNSYVTISNCYNTGDVSGSDKVGGVCGSNSYGTISNCYNTGKVTGTGEYNVGGVCGYNTYGTISNCYNTGDVSGSDKVGGVCGYNSSPISNCYNTGKVTGTGENVGGVCGSNDSEISNCYYLEGTSSTGIGSGSDSDDPKTLGELCELDLDDDGTAWTAGSYKEETNGRMRTLTYTLPSLIGVGTEQTIEFNYYNFSTTDEPDWQEYTPITDAAGLQAINNNLSGNYVLMNDIDLSTVDNFTPIGNAFTGKFSGDGHKIKNLTINSESDYIGLFGYSNGTIMNVGIEGGSVTGKDSVGGVCGVNEGTISNCYNTGAVSGTSFVGGVCGNNEGTISNCYNTGSVTGNDSVGGVCGYNGIKIENCYNTGSVTGYSLVGGVCGDNYVTIANCYYLEGTSSTGIGSGSDTAESKTLDELCASLPNNFDTNIWKAGSAPTEITTIAEGSRFGKKVYTLPSLNGVGTAQTISVDVYNFGTTETADWQEYISIRTAEELQAIGNDSTSLGKNYVLMEDIDLKDITNFTPIGTDINNAFTGKFSGNGHKIKNLTINKPNEDYIGLFGYSNGTIMNVGIEGGSVKGKEKVGGVCGENYAYSNGTATITNCYNTGTVRGSGNSVGGVCGFTTGGTIANCYNTGAVNGTGDSVGGVCGFTTGGTIANCYFDSTVYNGNAVGYNYGTPSENVLGKTTKQFTRGEVAYLLSQGCTVNDTTYNGDAWGQEIGKDLYPVLGGKKVLANSDQSAFANDIIIYGQSATLDGMIGMNIYVAADDNYEWSASFNGNPVEKPAKDENGLYKFTYQVAAKDMDNEIQFTVDDKIDVTVSVSDYLADLSKTDNESLKNLADSMSVYGDAAKAYFNGEAVAEQTVTEDLSVYDFAVGTMPEGISYYGSSLILESETTIRHYFTIAEGYGTADFVFTVNGSEAKLTESEKNPGYYFIDIKNISAEKLGTSFSVSVNGEDVITGYSALSYAKAVLESENTDANLKNLVKALYIYNQNACAYNNSNANAA